ncbi:MAG: AglZ/HisF2 family acetamidino modification protein [Bacillus sp. (in: Bacteria)]|nr:AglZ/HisF2 family acetamidino modification protein [Bacillus sp. (in: firmicutes)]MCM1425506.1 AglZ/HisF2 family acetamidino modification protein [Eubacterium sp.]
MYHNRLIPCLLLDNGRLVKTQQFHKPVYIGDPINAVKIFNDKEVDELVFLDINATKANRQPDFEYLRKITEQCFMPLCYGGGIVSIEDIGKLFRIGFEKVSINASAFRNLNLLKEAVKVYGSQSIVGAIDVGKNMFGKNVVKIVNGTQNTKLNPVEYAKMLEDAGAGEIFLNSITHDGMMQGYDYQVIEEVSSAVQIPVIACGGAGNLQDCKKAIESGASAAAAGSIFVFWGINRAVLINYPNSSEVAELFDMV